MKDNLIGLISFLSGTESDIVVTPYYREYEIAEDKFKEELINDISPNEVPENLNDFNEICNLSMHGLAIRTKLLKDNDISITEQCFYTDNEYVIYPLVYAETISLYNQPIYCYRLGRSGQSVSIDGARKHYKDTIKVATNIFKKIDISENAVSESKWKCFIEPKIERVCDMVYTYHLVINSDEAKQDLQRFDKKLKENKYLYAASAKIKKIKALRASFFAAYHALAKREIKKWNG